MIWPSCRDPGRRAGIPRGLTGRPGDVRVAHDPSHQCTLYRTSSSPRGGATRILACGTQARSRRDFHLRRTRARDLERSRPGTGAGGRAGDESGPATKGVRVVPSFSGTESDSRPTIRVTVIGHGFGIRSTLRVACASESRVPTMTTTSPAPAMVARAGPASRRGRGGRARTVMLRCGPNQTLVAGAAEAEASGDGSRDASAEAMVLIGWVREGQIPLRRRAACSRHWARCVILKRAADPPIRHI
jgi:hypothetical protein